MQPNNDTVIQRVLLKDSGGTLNPRLSNVKWNLLTEEQKTKAVRLTNDHYYAYYFRDYDHFFNYMAGTEDPTNTQGRWRKQGGGTNTKPFGEQDPFADHHDETGGGGFGLDSQHPFTFGGSPLKFKETASHESNWANFVEMHFNSAMKKLMGAGKWGGPAKQKLFAYYEKAIKHAERMDHQFVKKDTTMATSTTGDIWSGVMIEDNVNAMRTLVKEETGTPKSTMGKAILPKWGALHNGMGSSVKATFHGAKNQSIAVGSKADKKMFQPHWLKQLDQRVGTTNTSYYIEGHLLNDNLGGPAAPYNIVPLTEDANATHLHLVETYVKRKVLDMLWEKKSQGMGFSPLANPIDVVRYDVTADFSKHPRRKATDDWIDAYNFLKHVIDKLPTIKAKYDDKRKVSKFRDDLNAGNYMPHNVDGKSLNYASCWMPLQWAINFVIPIPSDRQNVDLAELLRRFDLVSELFIKEEEYVPVKLTCNSETERKDGTKDGDGQMTNVPVVNDIQKISAVAGFRE